MASTHKIETGAGTRWRIRVYIGEVEEIDPETGATKTVRKYLTRTFAKKRDADAESRRLERHKETGSLTVPSKDAVGTYLRRWLNEVMRGRLRARTWSDYSGVLRRYLEQPDEDAPPFRSIRMDRLSPEAIQSLYHHLQEKQGLSPRTIRSLHAIIRQGIAHAARTGAAARNVADLVVLPKQQRREVKAMSPEQASAFLKAARADRYYPLWCVLLTGGLRPGEALALKWADLDLDAAKIHVQRTLTRRGQEEPWALEEPKTSRGRRVVVLPGFVVQALREWRTAQARERLQLGSEYAVHGFVFATEFGKPLDGANLYARNFNRIMAAAELGKWEEPEPGREGKPGPKKGPTFRPAFRLYDLRHTAATLLLRAGINAKVTSERLGHASVAFTMDVYAASLPDLQEEAADKLDVMLGGA